MKKNSLYTYIASSLIILVPVPGRLSYGIILILALNALTALGILFRHLTKKLSVDEYMPALMTVFLIGLCIIYKNCRQGTVNCCNTYNYSIHILFSALFSG